MQTAGTVRLYGFTMKHAVLNPKSLFIENDQIQYFVPVSLFKTEVCEVQKQKGQICVQEKWSFSTISYIAQRQNVVTLHK